MPEIKHQFTGGKMNKDLDERIVPNGEYRDALNIQVSTSEGSEVGTVQNILGNALLTGQTFIPIDATCVGSIADEKNDRVYWFITSSTKDMILRADAAGGIELVFIDVNKNVLKFNGEIITGINIIDDLLFWTDNINEPRKINIQRSILGSFNGNAVQTKLLLNGIVTVDDVEERHITVIRKSPTRPLVMEMKTRRIYGRLNDDSYPVSYTGVFEVSDDPSNIADDILEIESVVSGTVYPTNDFANVVVGDKVKIYIPEDINGDSDFELDWLFPSNVNGSLSSSMAAEWNGTKILIREFDDGGSAPEIPIMNYRIKGVLTGWTNDDHPELVNDTSIQTGFDDTGRLMVEFEIKAITGSIPGVVGGAVGFTTRQFAIDFMDESEKLYEYKFPRFSYRYKYEDGEYSAFAPFTEIAFMPGGFDYLPKKGYNLGMTNRLTSIVVSDYIPDDIPEDVIEVDILYKEDGSPNIYAVETIRYNEEKTILSSGVLSNNWDINSYEIKDETVNVTLPSNQLLRPWDNVPKRSLAQEVTGNRIVYANYLQGFDLTNVMGDDYYPNFTHSLTQHTVSSEPSLPSIKSLREYQLGVVFIDKYGRETPVFSNPTGTFKVEKALANTPNRIKAGFSQALGFLDDDIKYFKFFIKETSGEYYNLSMDRFYDAGDGNRWLSFPSSDRNKVDIDTFLILKKSQQSSELILEPARYKILAIESEAPDFIKTKKLLIDSNIHTAGTGPIYYPGISGNPIQNQQEIVLNYDNYENSTGSHLHEIDDGVLWIEFGIPGQGTRSKRYEINKITLSETVSLNNSGLDYYITLKKKLKEDVDFISNDPTGANPTDMLPLSSVRIYNYTVKNEAEYDGRFFAKIFADNLFTVLFEQHGVNNTFNYVPIVGTSQKKIYGITTSMKDTHSMYQTGFVHHNTTISGSGSVEYYSDYGDVGYSSTSSVITASSLGMSDFGQFAPYFRDYITANNDNSAQLPGAMNAIQRMNRYDGNTWQDYPSSRLKFGTDIGTPGCGSFSTAIDPPAWVREFMSSTSPLASGNATEGRHLWSCFTGPSNNSHNMVQGWDFPYPYQNRDAKNATNYTTNHGRDTEVWFIDAGDYQATSTGDDLNWSALTTTSGAYSGIVNMAGVNFTMQLGLGGIWGHGTSWTGTPGGTNICDSSIKSDFFLIGDAASPEYADQTTINLVSNMSQGLQWRWKEDPHGIIYINSAPTIKKNSFRYSYKASHSSSHPDCNDGRPYNLEPNFTKNFKITCTPALTAASWIPFDNTFGPITAGHDISISSVEVGGVTAINTTAGTQEDYTIYLDSATGQGLSTATNEQTSIVPGMIVTSYNSGANPLQGVWDATLTVTPYLAVKSVEVVSTYTKVVLTGYVTPLDPSHCFTPTVNEEIRFQQPKINGYSPNSAIRISWEKSSDYSGDLLMAIGYTMEWVDGLEIEGEDEDALLSTDPAIWETEPKEFTGLDIYYEMDGYNAVKYNAETIRSVLPIGSTIKRIETSTFGNPAGTANSLETAATVINNTPTPGINDAVIEMDTIVDGLTAAAPADVLEVTRPDGSMFQIRTGDTPDVNSTRFIVSPDTHGDYTLNWHNCYTFFNGVESDRIRDNFNLPFISNGVKASTTLQEKPAEEHRKYGLIYSGIYNSSSGINNLNQFIAAEKITKDINPIYGSIQKLHSRSTADGDLITLCEDRILKILANKDAIYNADGNPQLTANENVLGQTIPFSGDFGISKNPESFASESYRVYFTDKVRGTVMRLSKDGLTPISMHGMKDWFKDNLKLSNELIGSYDDNKSEYNITLADREILGDELIVGGDFDPFDPSYWYIESGWTYINGKIEGNNVDKNYKINQGLPVNTFIDGRVYEINFTVSGYIEGEININLFNENGRGFAITSFAPENGVYTFTREVGTFNTSTQQYWSRFWIQGSYTSPNPLFTGNIDNISIKEIISAPTTVSFKEDVKGWVSFKSFIPESGISMANNYYTALSGKLYKHHYANVNNNNFYGIDYNSSFDVILNDFSGSIKTFHTLDYEGSQSKVDVNLSDNDYYNLTAQPGWSISSIITDKQEGNINEFIEKEGKWFNYIKGVNSGMDTATDFGAFDIQGIGTLVEPPLLDVLTFSSINTSLQIGDRIYFQTPVGVVGGFNTINANNISEYGSVSALTNTTITVVPAGAATPVVDDYIMFAKNHIVNTSGLVGYFANVRFENNSTSDAELFSVGSEITESSK